MQHPIAGLSLGSTIHQPTDKLNQGCRTLLRGRGRLDVVLLVTHWHESRLRETDSKGHDI